MRLVTHADGEYLAEWIDGAEEAGSGFLGQDDLIGCIYSPVGPAGEKRINTCSEPR